MWLLYFPAGIHKNYWLEIWRTIGQVRTESIQCWNISKSWGISINYCTFSFLLTARLLVANKHFCPWWRSALSVCLSSLLLFLSKVNTPVIHFQGNCTNECNTYVMTGQNRKVKVARLLDLRVDRRLLFPRWTKNIPQVMARPSQMPSDADWEVGKGGVGWRGEGGCKSWGNYTNLLCQTSHIES